MKVTVNEVQPELKKGTYLKEKEDIYIITDLMYHNKDMDVVCISSPNPSRLGQSAYLTQKDILQCFTIIPNPFTSSNSEQ